jgi:hypothetical protein
VDAAGITDTGIPDVGIGQLYSFPPIDGTIVVRMLNHTLVCVNQHYHLPQLLRARFIPALKLTFLLLSDSDHVSTSKIILISARMRPFT